MKIYLYNNVSDDNAVHKSLVNELALEGTLTYREEAVSITSPVITVKANTSILTKNYAYIPEFQRYYFFSKAPDVMHGNIYRLYLDVDVLMSFKGTAANGYSDGFLGNVGYVDNSLNYGNFYLNDSALPVQQDTKITTRLNFNSGFGGKSMIMNCINLGVRLLPSPEVTNGNT